MYCARFRKIRNFSRIREWIPQLPLRPARGSKTYQDRPGKSPLQVEKGFKACPVLLSWSLRLFSAFNRSHCRDEACLVRNKQADNAGVVPTGGDLAYEPDVCVGFNTGQRYLGVRYISAGSAHRPPLHGIFLRIHFLKSIIASLRCPLPRRLLPAGKSR